MINYTEDPKTVDFVLTIHLDSFDEKPEAWDLFGSIARSDMPLDQCLETMAKMVREIQN